MNNTIFTVSVWTKSYHISNGSPLDVVNFKSVLDYQVSIPSNHKKGDVGSMFAYLSKTNLGKKSSTHFPPSGIIFIDIDHLDQSTSNFIYNNFNKLSEYVPNLLAMQYSYSGNLHLYVWDDKIVMNGTKEDYKEKSKLYNAFIAASINKLFNIDLREIPDAIDLHSGDIKQQLFLNHIDDYKWNEMCTPVSIDNKTIKQLHAEYPMIFEDNKVIKIKKNSISPHSNSSYKPMNGEKSVIDKNFYLFNRSGYEARTMIASTAFYHFGMDIDVTETYLNDVFVYDNEWKAQLESLIRNNNISKFYNKDAETYLFPSDSIMLEEGKYLSDVLDLDKMDDKYIYIQSGTNTGKTEFIKRYLRTHDNSCIVQMTKALRDGKKQGVENYTYGNWDKFEDKSRVHTTIEGFMRNSINININDYTVFVDETHLLQDYIGVKYDSICGFLDELSKAKKVIFLSATPKQDAELFDFKKLKFSKHQPQEISICRCPLRYSKDKGSKENAKYSYINKFVNERVKKGKKIVIFSDRNQESYKKYGLSERNDVTYFNANNYWDEAEQSILNYNRLDNPITLATRYLGVGVEIKNEEEIDMVFCLDEGFTTDFIEQCIGRPRDAKRINIFAFYTSNMKRDELITNDEMCIINDCFNTLNITDEEGETHLNLIAAKGINLFDETFYNKSYKDKVKLLKVGNIIDARNNISPTDLGVFESYPYKKVECVDMDETLLNIGGLKKKERYESELETYLLSLSNSALEKLFMKTYDEIYEEVPYEDKTNARKYISVAKRFFYKGIGLKEALDYFGKISKANSVMKKLYEYVGLKRGINVLEHVDGLEKKEEQIQKDMEIVEKVFTPEFLKLLIDKVRVDSIDFNFDSLFAEVAGVEPIEQCKVFNGMKYEDDIKLREGSGRVNEKVSIININDNTIMEFESKSDCKKFLNVGSEVFSKFMKGIKTKVDKQWKLYRHECL